MQQWLADYKQQCNRTRVGITKQIDNGKIAYNAFGEANTLSIVSHGTAQDGSDWRVKMWATGIYLPAGRFTKSRLTAPSHIISDSTSRWLSGACNEIIFGITVAIFHE